MKIDTNLTQLIKMPLFLRNCLVYKRSPFSINSFLIETTSEARALQTT